MKNQAKPSPAYSIQVEGVDTLEAHNQDQQVENHALSVQYRSSHRELSVQKEQNQELMKMLKGMEDMLQRLHRDLELERKKNSATSIEKSQRGRISELEKSEQDLQIKLKQEQDQTKSFSKTETTLTTQIDKIKKDQTKSDLKSSTILQKQQSTSDSKLTSLEKDVANYKDSLRLTEKNSWRPTPQSQPCKTNSPKKFQTPRSVSTAASPYSKNPKQIGRTPLRPTRFKK